jgi:hypothetical protein
MSVSAEVRRTLVKSPPELWAELSDPAALGRHLGELGEIRITDTDPERTVDWEATGADGGPEVSGRVEIEPSGWGTRVTLSASRALVAPEPAEGETEAVSAKPESVSELVPEVIEVMPTTEVQSVTEPIAETSPESAVDHSPTTEVDAEPEPVQPEPAASDETAPRPGFFARLFRRRRIEQPQAEPELVIHPMSMIEPESMATPDPSAAVEVKEPAFEDPVPEESTLAGAKPEEPAQAEEDAPELDISAELAALEEQTTAVLTGVLDRLGAANHRPFSRA